MASPLRYRINDSAGTYHAATRHAEDAAMHVAALGDGAKIIDKRIGRVVWREGHEAFPAADSYDGVAQIIFQRTDKIVREALAKAGITA